MLLSAVLACGEPQAPPPVRSEVVPDLDVGWIARRPRMPYVWGSDAADREGWPTPGDTVAWQASVRNWSPRQIDDVAYSWILDGDTVATGTVGFRADSVATVEYRWPWTFDRHTLTFVIDPQRTLVEETERNNRLTVFTDALSIGFWVERSAYRHFHDIRADLKSGFGLESSSYEDWAQRQVAMLNQMFAQAIYPETPDGVRDRIRVDQVTIVGDGTIQGYLCPAPDDRTVDLQWGQATRPLAYALSAQSPPTDRAFYWSYVMMHETMHARYLVDIYAYSVSHGDSTHWVGITQNDTLVAGTKYMPFEVGGLLPYVYVERLSGLMNTGEFHLSEHSAWALNRLAGRRATQGNCNPPGNLGAYLRLLPAETSVRILDSASRPLASARVSVFTDNGIDSYSDVFDDLPDLETSTDDSGYALLGPNPFGPRLDPVAPDEEPKTETAIVRVVLDGKVGYAFLPSYFYNLEYARGHAVGSHDLRVTLHD